MVRRAPLVGNAPHPAVEGKRELEDVLSVDLVQRTCGSGLHACLRGPAVREVAVRVEAVLGAHVLGVPKRVCVWHDEYRPRVQQPLQPRVLFTQTQIIFF